MHRSLIENIVKSFLTLLAIALFSTRIGAQTLTIGSISDEPAVEIRTFLPFARYLEAKLSKVGIKKVKVRVARSVSEMAEFFKQGKMDVYIDSPFSALTVSRLSDSRITLRRWKKGVAEYHSVVFVRKDSGIQTVASLRGKMIAFEEPFSSSSYQLPLLSLQEEGLNLVEKRNATVRVRPREIGYVFSNHDQNTVVWVLHGKVAAGAMNNAALIEEAKGSLEQLQVIHKTFTVPRHLTVVRNGLPPELDQSLERILLDMHKTKAGRETLEQFERTARFDPIPQGFNDRLPLLNEFIEFEFGLEMISAKKEQINYPENPDEPE